MVNLRRNIILSFIAYLLQVNLVTSFATGRVSRDAARFRLKPQVALPTELKHNRLIVYSNTFRRKCSSLNMVIDRMGDDSVRAIMKGHEVGNDLGLTSLTNELIFLGVVDTPERAGRTFARYGVQYPLVRRSAIKILEKAGYQLNNHDVNRNNEEEEIDRKPLPFSLEAKNTLTDAAKIADVFKSDSITSEHILLALMAYNFGKPIDQTKVTTAREVMLGTEGVAIEDKSKFSAFDFCEEVIEDMKLPYDPQQDKVIEQVVIGGGSEPSKKVLEEVGVDLTQMAVEGKFDRVYGRDKEIRTVLRTLGRRRKNNPCLIGDPGVGKTAIAEAVAQVLASSYEVKEGFQAPKLKINNPFQKDEETEASEAPTEEVIEDTYTLPSCPETFKGYRLISIELASLVAGTRNRGDFEQKVQSLIREASNSNVILFIDEIHNLVGTGGGGDGAMNAANLIKPALARGELRLLGATTTPEYRRYIEKDGALERRFQPVNVVEPTVDETLEILKTIAPNYAVYHSVEYTDNALTAAAKLSDRYISDRYLPDKAIDLLDESGSMVKMSEFEEDYFVTEDAITAVVSEMSGIPVGKLETGERDKLRNLELTIGDRIKGQMQAVKAVAKAIRRARSGMREVKRPVASLLFLGPTGVGKTEVTKALADTYFGQEKDMIRIDMSEYMDRFSTTRLIGSPPGYVGYEEGGQLTEAVRRRPHSVVLFDEVEKAHEDVLNILLQIMDEGTLTDGKGRTVSFKNTIVIMTSNIGSEEISKAYTDESQGEITAESTDKQSQIIAKAMEKALTPELRNRLDEVVYFKPLTYDTLLEITTNLLENAIDRARKDQDMIVTVSDDIAAQITREAFQQSRQYGARPVRRAIQKYFEDTMSDAIMREFIDPGDEVLVEMAEDNSDKNDVPSYVKISKFPRGTKESITLPVDDGAIVGSITQDLEQAIFRENSSDDMSTENDATWE